MAIGRNEIEAGDQVIIELETANRDTDVFGSDANVFNPLRARPPGRNPSGLSFGLGMHVCIGLNLVAGTIVRDEQALDETTHQYGFDDGHSQRTDSRRPRA